MIQKTKLVGLFLATAVLVGAPAAAAAAQPGDGEGSDSYTERVAAPAGATTDPGNVEFDSASVTLGIVPSATEWIALSGSPDLVDSATGVNGSEGTDGVPDLLPVGVNDYLLVTVTKVDTSESIDVVLDANNASGGAISNQAVLYGRHPSVLQVVQIDFSTDPPSYHTLTEPETGMIDSFVDELGPGDYRFDLSFRNEFSTEAGHQEVWVVAQGPGVGAAGSAGSPLLWILVGVLAAGLASGLGAYIWKRTAKARWSTGTPEPGGQIAANALAQLGGHVAATNAATISEMNKILGQLGESVTTGGTRNWNQVIAKAEQLIMTHSGAESREAFRRLRGLALGPWNITANRAEILKHVAKQRQAAMWAGRGLKAAGALGLGLAAWSRGSQIASGNTSVSQTYLEPPKTTLEKAAAYMAGAAETGVVVLATKNPIVLGIDLGLALAFGSKNSISGVMYRGINAAHYGVGAAANYAGTSFGQQGAVPPPDAGRVQRTIDQVRNRTDLTGDDKGQIVERLMRSIDQWPDDPNAQVSIKWSLRSPAEQKAINASVEQLERELNQWGTGR